MRNRIFLDHGIRSRNDVVSYLREDRFREVDARAPACRTSGNPPDHYGSLDVTPVPDGEQNYRGFRAPICATSRCDGSAHRRHSAARPFSCPRLSSKHRNIAQLDAILITEADVAHELHVLDVPDTICKHRLRQRNADGEHPYEVSEETFEIFTSYFVPPGSDEGFNIVTHTP